MANKAKAQEKLMNALEKSLLALANGDSNPSDSSKELGRLMKKKSSSSSASSKQKRPDQVLYTVLKGKKSKDEDYVSMPVKKSDPEPLKKEKKTKRTPVNFPIVTARLGDSSSHLVTPRPAAVPRPAPIQAPPPLLVNQWSERTGADLFANPAARNLRNYSSGLDFEDELMMVLEESRRTAQNEERVRDMYLEQHYQAQHLLENRPRPSYEAPPKETPYSSRSDNSIYFDDSLPAKIASEDYYHPETIYADSDDDWTTVPSSNSSRPAVPESSSHSEKKKAKKSEKKAKEEIVALDETTSKKSKKKSKEKDSKDSNSEMVLESGKKKRKKTGDEESEPLVPSSVEAPTKSTGAIKKTKPVKTKAEERDKRQIEEVDSGMKPGLANDAPKQTKSKSRKIKSESASIAEMQLSGVSDPFSKPQREKAAARAASCKSNKKSDSAANILHNYGVDNDFECEEEAFEPVVAVANEIEAEEDISESDDESSSPETVDYVTIYSHPHLFDPTNFLGFYGASKDDEFYMFCQHLPLQISRYISKFRIASNEPEILPGQIENVLESVSHKTRSPETIRKLNRTISISSSEEDEPDHQNDLKLKSPVKEISTESSSSVEPLRRPRLPGSGRLKIPSNPEETISSISSSKSSAELQRMLCGNTDLSTNTIASTPVAFNPSKADMNDALRFSPSLEPIYETNGSAEGSVKSGNSAANQNSIKLKSQQEKIYALQSSLTDEDFVNTLAEEILKLNLVSPNSPNMMDEIEKEIGKLVDDEDSPLWRLVDENMSKVPSNGETVVQLPGNLPSQNENIKPLPIDLAFSSLQMASTTSLPSSNIVNENGLPQQNLSYNNNTILQMNAQSSFSNINSLGSNGPFPPPAQSGLSLISAAAENGMTALSYGSTHNQNIPVGDQKESNTLPQVPIDNASQVNSSGETISAAGSTPANAMTLNLDGIKDFLKLMLVMEAGENAGALMNSVEFQVVLPLLAATVQSQLSQFQNPASVIEPISRELIRRMLTAQAQSSLSNVSQSQMQPQVQMPPQMQTQPQTQIPPGLNLPSQSHYPYPAPVNSLSSNCSVPPGLFPGYPPSYVQSSLPSDMIQTNVFPAYSGAINTGHPFISGSSVYNSVPAGLYGPGVTPISAMHTQIPANINTPLK